MNTPAIRGWCPSAYRPMASGDGLVVRVRPPAGQLTADQAKGLADAAQRHGNGLIDLTTRANLQIRGVEPEGHGPLLLDLAELGLLHPDPGVEARSNIVTDPLAEGDLRTLHGQIVEGLTAGLAGPEFASLPSKFGFVVDAGTARYLAEISGDIRIEASGSALIVRADGRDAGRRVACAAEAVATALSLARWFIASGAIGPDGRGRMAQHLERGVILPDALAGDAAPNPPAAPPHPGTRSGGLLVGVAFGQLTVEDLARLAASAPYLRITPWRMVYLPGLDQTDALAAGPNLVTDPSDPLLRVQACPGASGCAQASVETRDLARDLVRRLPSTTDLHVSGCAKGCAHRSASALTLVGRAGSFDLVRDGTAWDEPLRRGIDPLRVSDIIDG